MSEHREETQVFKWDNGMLCLAVLGRMGSGWAAVPGSRE